MTRKARRKREQERARGILPRVTETWYQRQHREQVRDLWTIATALAVAAIAIAVLK